MNDIDLAEQAEKLANASAIASKVQYSGAGAALLFGLTINEIGVIIGITVGVLGFLINIYFSWRSDQRQILADKRFLEKHNLEMSYLRNRRKEDPSYFVPNPKEREALTGQTQGEENGQQV